MKCHGGKRSDRHSSSCVTFEFYSFQYNAGRLVWGNNIASSFFQNNSESLCEVFWVYFFQFFVFLNIFLAFFKFIFSLAILILKNMIAVVVLYCLQLLSEETFCLSLIMTHQQQIYRMPYQNPIKKNPTSKQFFKRVVHEQP